MLDTQIVKALATISIKTTEDGIKGKNLGHGWRNLRMVGAGKIKICVHQTYTTEPNKYTHHPYLDI